MTDLDRLRQVRDFLISVRDNTGEDPIVRAKAQEVIALFDAPSLAAMLAMFNGGTVAQKLASLGSLQSAIIRGVLGA